LFLQEQLKGIIISQLVFVFLVPMPLSNAGLLHRRSGFEHKAPSIPCFRGQRMQTHLPASTILLLVSHAFLFMSLLGFCCHFDVLATREDAAAMFPERLFL
jgi:hypothetical protein